MSKPWRVYIGHPDDIEPMEIWDRPMPDGRLLHELARGPVLGPRLKTDAEEAKRFGAVLMKTLPEILEAPQLYLMGGLVDLRAASPVWWGRLAQIRYEAGLGWPYAPEGDDPFAAEPGGFQMLDRLRPRVLEAPRAILDLGQARLKTTWLFERGTHRRLVDRPGDDIDALAEALAELAREVGIPRLRAVALALPCELLPDRQLGPCTYKGLEGDLDTVVNRLLAGLPMLYGRVVVCNDAVMAAMAAQVHQDYEGPGLVITMGFGPGAAWIRAPR